MKFWAMTNLAPRPDDSGYFVYVNSAVESVLGFTSAQLVGTHFTQWIHSAWRDQVVPFYTKQFHDFILETTLEFEVLAADGERHWQERMGADERTKPPQQQPDDHGHSHDSTRPPTEHPQIRLGPLKGQGRGWDGPARGFDEAILQRTLETEKVDDLHAAAGTG